MSPRRRAGEGEVTREGLRWLKRKVLKAGHVNRLDLDGLKPDRRSILPSGLAILEALFDALDVQTMVHSEGALREGVLYELLGRHHHEDVRERSLTALAERSHVDHEQAARVESKAISLLERVAPAWGSPIPSMPACCAGRPGYTRWGWMWRTIIITSTVPI